VIAQAPGFPEFGGLMMTLCLFNVPLLPHFSIASKATARAAIFDGHGQLSAVTQPSRMASMF
jgi:hypothetical protein